MADPATLEGGLAGQVVAFARALRSAGVAVSSAEIGDAVEALRLLPLERRAAVRTGLAACLLKEAGLRQTFDRLFDIYFPLRRSVPARPARGDGDFSGELVEALANRDSERLRALASDRVERHGDLRPEANVREDAYVFRALRGLNLDAILSQLQDETVQGKGVTALQRRVVQEDLSERLQMFREMLKDEVFSRLLDHAGAEAMAARERRPPPDEVDFLWARDDDLEGLRAALAPLARKLARRLSHKRRAARNGRLDVRRTIRRSLSAGGHLVEPRFRRPSSGKPEIVLLCDISGSMRAFAKFTLELTYALATQFQRVRSFVFVDALDEVTHLLEASSDFAAALARVDREAEVVTLDGQSWYGNCLAQFWQRAGRDLGPRTTVIVVGDARNNFRSPGAEHLQRVRDRVHKVYWLNPEPRGHWNAGDSVMSQFEPVCDAVFEVRNLRQLQGFVEQAL